MTASICRALFPRSTEILPRGGHQFPQVRTASRSKVNFLLNITIHANQLSSSVRKVQKHQTTLAASRGGRWRAAFVLLITNRNRTTCSTLARTETAWLKVATSGSVEQVRSLETEVSARAGLLVGRHRGRSNVFSGTPRPRGARYCGESPRSTCAAR